MAISSTGIGSGLDVQSLVSKLLEVEKQPLKQLQTRGTTLSSKVSSWGTVKSQLAALQDAAQKLMGLTSWTGRTFSSSNTSALTGSATSSATAGSYSVNVTQLAKAQAVRSATGVTADSAIGQSGSLEITLGSWSGSSFSPAGSAVTVNIDAADNLGAIATKINAGNAGVTATVVTADGKDNLVIRSKDTGAAQGFQIRAFDGSDATGSVITTGTGLGSLAYASNSGAMYGLATILAGQDASATIDGIVVTSATNTISGAVPGLTLNLTETTSAPVTVTIGQDTEATRSAIQGFVDAYNTLTKTLANATRYDQASGAAGPLQGDGTAIGILNTLKRMVGALGPSGTSYARMSDVGLELQQDGTLLVNNKKLTAALANPADLQKFFSATSGDATSTGLARRFYDFAFGANATSGVVTERNNALQKAIKRNKDDINRFNDRLERNEARLYKMYTSLDSKMASLNSLSQYVAQQVTTWNKSS
ncbi:flagellar filament capping protein FliD [Hydrogenophaga aquatica]